MSIHRCFGANLRSYCYQHASIAEVCKGIGINRQQFNKYLAGQSLPNATTLRRICGFLKISEEKLFTSIPENKGSATGAVRSKMHSLRSQQNNAILANISGDLSSLSNGTLDGATQALLPGYYHCYFPLPGNERFLMRSLVKVSLLQGTLVFQRLTIFPSRARKGSYLAKSKHFGIIAANSHEIYFFGINSSAPHQLSFMSFERLNNGMPRLLSGLAITRTATEPLAARVCLQYLGLNPSVRPLLLTLGPIGTDNTSLDPFVLSAVSPQQGACSNRISPMGFHQTFVHGLTSTANGIEESSANRSAR